MKSRRERSDKHDRDDIILLVGWPWRLYVAKRSQLKLKRIMARLTRSPVRYLIITAAARAAYDFAFVIRRDSEGSSALAGEGGVPVEFV